MKKLISILIGASIFTIFCYGVVSLGYGITNPWELNPFTLIFLFVFSAVLVATTSGRISWGKEPEPKPEPVKIVTGDLKEDLRLLGFHENPCNPFVSCTIGRYTVWYYGKGSLYVETLRGDTGVHFIDCDTLEKVNDVIKKLRK